MLTAGSLEKLFNATGSRPGFVVGCEELLRAVLATHMVMAYCSSGPTQNACTIGIKQTEKQNWWAKNAKDVGARIGKLCDILDEVGLTVRTMTPSKGMKSPVAAWFILIHVDKIKLPHDYTYPHLVERQGTGDWKVCIFLVQEFGITSIPGTSFYGAEKRALGERYIRLRACNSDAGPELAVERLSKLRPRVR